MASISLSDSDGRERLQPPQSVSKMRSQVVELEPLANCDWDYAGKAVRGCYRLSFFRREYSATYATEHPELARKVEVCIVDPAGVRGALAISCLSGEMADYGNALLDEGKQPDAILTRACFDTDEGALLWMHLSDESPV